MKKLDTGIRWYDEIDDFMRLCNGLEERTLFVMLNRFFHLTEHNTNVKTELLAGVATFLTMAYIVVVNPQILTNAGMSFSGVLFATILVCAISSIAMGLFANLPYAVAPGMGINAFFTFGIVLSMKISWETALGAVFISGIFFVILSLTGIRTQIVKAIPPPLRYGLAAGIGIFLALIGLSSVDFVVPASHTLLGFGGISVTVLLFSFGFVLTAVLSIKGIRGALTIGIVSVSLMALIVSHAGMAFGILSKPIVTFPHTLFALPSFEVVLKLDIIGACSLGMIVPVFSIFFVDLFDSVGTFVGVAEVSGLVDKDGIPLNIDKALLVDAGSTVISGLFGTSSGNVFVESAAGIREGGRTGLTAITAGILFIPFMFCSPLLSFVPSVATAPVLVLVGIYMTQPLMRIRWDEYEEAIPAFLALVLVPLTFSITQGVIWSFLAYTAMKLLSGKARDIHWMLYVIDAFAIVNLAVRG